MKKLKVHEKIFVPPSNWNGQDWIEVITEAW